jgi:glutathione synthase/RimK-type ligase-like ATP-grasp enzyme
MPSSSAARKASPRSASSLFRDLSAEGHPRLLIITQQGDTHAYAVAVAARRKGASVCLWHTSDFPRSARVVIKSGRDFSFEADGLDLTGFDTTFDVVWHRRPCLNVDHEALHPSDVRFAHNEAQALQAAVFDLVAPKAFWVNPRQAANKASNKVLQIAAAHKVRFATPRALYSNHPDEIRRFIGAVGGRAIYKPLVGLVWEKGASRFMIYTAIVTADSLVDDSLLQNVPGIYQEVVPKAYEVRITMCGSLALGVRLWSQDTSRGKLDWRRAYGELKMEAMEIPSGVQRRCARVLRQLGIVFGCFDFIVTPAGEWVFLEVNQMGQFLFLEEPTGLCLLDAFTEFLLGRSFHFLWQPKPDSIRYSEVLPKVQRMAKASLKLHAPTPENVEIETP